MEVWKCGSLAALAVWKSGSAEVWKCGSLEVWQCVSVAVVEV